jgi:hypothetical protein
MVKKGKLKIKLIFDNNFMIIDNRILVYLLKELFKQYKFL